jgi:hypothetical protein
MLLNPTILMMKSAEDRPSNELAEPLDRPTTRQILVQGQVRSQVVVIGGVGRKDSAQMALAEDDDVIETGGSNRSVSPHAHSARATSGRSGDRVRPWLQGAS